MTQKARDFLIAVTIGTTGGALFTLAGVPLGWLLGALCLATVAAMRSVPLYMPSWLRTLMIVVLGVLIGSAFTPDVMHDASSWLLPLGMLLVFVIGAGGLSRWFFYRVGKYDRITSFFAAAPGGLNEMVLMGQSMGGDDRVISLSHAIRILVVVATVPLFLRLWEGAERITTLTPPGATVTARDVAILGAAGIAGFALARLIRLPASQLTGPMLLSAAVHILGWTAANPPALLVIVAQVIIGTAIGCRFVGVDFFSVRRILWVSAVAALVTIALAIGFAYGADRLFDIGFARMLLSLAPGGVAEMSLTALALNVDTAFVSTHHVARIAMVVVLAPIIFRAGRKLLGTAETPPSDPKDRQS